MGIGDWFGWGRKDEPEPPPVRTVPTSERLTTALDDVERMAREGAVPGLVMSRLTRVTRIVRETIPRLDALGSGSPQAYNVMATATNYLPEAIGGYLRLPRDWANSRPVDGSKTSLMVLVDQLDLLGATMDQVFDAVCRADANALVVHGRFLQEKFGRAGGDLALDGMSAAPPPTGSDGQPTPLVPPDAAPGPLQPPIGRQA
jgi:hypothetical protein